MAKRRREDPLLNQAECLGVHHDASEGAFLDRVAAKYAQGIGALQIGEIGGRADRIGPLEQSDGLLPHRDVLGKPRDSRTNPVNMRVGLILLTSGGFGRSPAARSGMGWRERTL
jgi:hypothetical protein